MTDPYIGEIRMFAGSYAPIDWHFCDGTTLSIAQYQALFSLIGTTYGGDGSSNFKLPDLRGRVVVGGGGTPGGGISAYAVGQTWGVATVTLSVAQMPAHNHNVVASTQAGTTKDPQSALFATSSVGTIPAYTDNNKGGVSARDMDAAIVENTGGNQAHSNLMPTFGVSYIISLNGIYPQA